MWQEQSILIAISDFEMTFQVAEMLRGLGVQDITAAPSVHDAIAMMNAKNFTMFIIDARVPVAIRKDALIHGGVDFIRFIRMCRKPICESKIVFVRSPFGMVNLLESRAEVMTARDAGANCTLRYPVSRGDFEKIVLPELRITRPFLKTADYTGPCRRRRNLEIIEERRQCPQMRQPLKKGP